MDSSSPQTAAATAAVSQTPQPVVPLDGMSLRRYMALVGWGLLATTLGQMIAIGEKPLRFLLKDQLGLTPVEMAAWFSLVALPWSFKPIAGLLTDALPLFGSRRKYYLLIATFFTGALWLAMNFVPRNFQWLVWTGIWCNITMVMASVVTGGLLVEGAQSHGATGRLSSLRLVIINATSVIAGPVGGLLAAKWFGWTTIVAATLFFSLIPVALLLLRERMLTVEERRQNKLHRATQQLKAMFKSKTLWIAGGLFFLVQVAPGLYTPLFYYQTEKLKFSPTFIGNLAAINGGMGLLASFVYPFVCRRFRLRVLLAFAIVCTVASNLAYLGYVGHTTAMIIEGVSGLGITLAQLPLFDLAARATPRGSEALAYSLMIACWNIGLSLSDVLGSWLFDRFGQTFKDLVWVNAGTTALVLLAVPFLPGFLVDQKEGAALTPPSPGSIGV